MRTALHLQRLTCQSMCQGGPTPHKMALAVACCFAVGAAHANPTGASIVSGSTSINQQGNLLTVINTPNAIINWQRFSIGANEITRFIQQSASSAVLNRVVGVDPSVILGTLTSNGRVFLINPNGVLFGAGSRVDVAGLVASTLNLSNADFLAGRLRFAETPGAASVVNQGSITTPNGGQVYLIAPNVQNSGIINSPQGEVILAAGKTVEIVDSGTPNLRVELTASDNEALNVGKIVANSGKIGIYAGLIRNSGEVRADGVVVGANGEILLKATQNIAVEPGAVVSASSGSGSNDGGSVRLIAGDTLTLAAGAEVRADGGQFAGNGGLIEFSGHRQVQLNGTHSARAFAPGYRAGSLIFDPYNVEITTTGSCSSDIADCSVFDPSSLATDFPYFYATIQANNNIYVSSGADSRTSLTLVADYDGNGVGAIVQRSPSAVLKVDGNGYIYADAASGIGSAAAPLRTNTGNLYLNNSTSHGIYVDNASATDTSLSVETWNRDVNVTWNGGARYLTFDSGSGRLDALSSSYLSFSNSAGAIQTGSVKVVGYNQLTLRASGDIGNATPGSLIDASNSWMVLDSGGKIGSAASPLNTKSTGLYLNTTSSSAGGIFVANIGNVYSLDIGSASGDASITWQGGQFLHYVSATGKFDLAAAPDEPYVSFSRSSGDIRPSQVNNGTGLLALTASAGQIRDFDNDTAIGAGRLSVDAGAGNGQAIRLNNVTSDLSDLSVITGGGNVHIQWKTGTGHDGDEHEGTGAKSLILNGASGNLDISSSSGTTDISVVNRGGSLKVGSVDAGTAVLNLRAHGDIADQNNSSHIRAGRLGLASESGSIDIHNVKSDLSELAVAVNDHTAAVRWSTDRSAKELGFDSSNLLSTDNTSGGGTDVTFMNLNFSLATPWVLWSSQPAGNLLLGAVDLGTNKLTVASGGQILQQSAASTRAGEILLLARSGMGSESAPLQVDTGTLSLYNAVSGNVFVKSVGPASSQLSLAGLPYDFGAPWPADQGRFAVSYAYYSQRAGNSGGSVVLSSERDQLNIDAPYEAAGNLSLRAPRIVDYYSPLSAGGALTLEASQGNLYGGALVDAHTVNLVAADSLTWVGGISAQNLYASGGRGAVDLGSGNAVTTIAGLSGFDNGNWLDRSFIFGNEGALNEPHGGSGDLTVGTVNGHSGIAAGGLLSLTANQGALTIVQNASGKSVAVGAQSLRVDGASLFATGGDVDANLTRARAVVSDGGSIISSSGTINLTAGGDVSVSGSNSRLYANNINVIAANGNIEVSDGGRIAGASDIYLTAGGLITVDGSVSRIETVPVNPMHPPPMTITLVLPNHSNGGYLVNGVERVADGTGGFYVNQTPAVVGINLLLNYGRAPVGDSATTNPAVPEIIAAINTAIAAINTSLPSPLPAPGTENVAPGTAKDSRGNPRESGQAVIARGLRAMCR